MFLSFVQAVLHAMCGVTEYEELPVRHNEDILNLRLSAEVSFALAHETGKSRHSAPCHRRGLPDDDLSTLLLNCPVQ